MTECRHRDFQAAAAVHRLTADATPDAPVVAYRLEVWVVCGQCQQPFAFQGLPRGYHPHRPTVSADGTAARLPMVPAEDPIWGPGGTAREA